MCAHIKNHRKAVYVIRDSGMFTQRMQTIQARKKLTDEWRERGIETDKEYAILTSEMTKAWSGKTVREYKELKGLKKESLRDNNGFAPIKNQRYYERIACRQNGLLFTTYVRNDMSAIRSS